MSSKVKDTIFARTLSESDKSLIQHWLCSREPSSCIVRMRLPDGRINIDTRMFFTVFSVEPDVFYGSVTIDKGASPLTKRDVRLRQRFPFRIGPKSSVREAKQACFDTTARIVYKIDQGANC